MTANRKLLGRNNTAAARQQVYETADGLEVSSSELYDVALRRVLWEEVRLVTYHRELGTMFLVLNGIAAALFLLIMGLVMLIPGSEWVIGLVFLILATPFLIAIVVRLMFRLDIVTVYGKRSKASMKWSFRKARARQVYLQVVSRSRDAQRKLEQQIRAEEAERAASMPADELPPMPEGF